MPVPSPLFGGPLSATVLKSAVADLLNQDPLVPEGAHAELVTALNHDRVDIVVATRVVDNEKVRWDLDVIGSHAWGGDTGFGILSRITLK